MKGYAATDMFTSAELTLCGKAKGLVHRVPDAWEVRCHELARAVGEVLSLEVVDGKFGAVEHSWLSLDPVAGHRHILDVYTPGCIPMVTLKDLFWGLPDTRNYAEGDARDDIDHEMVSKIVEHVTYTPENGCKYCGFRHGPNMGCY